MRCTGKKGQKGGVTDLRPIGSCWLLVINIASDGDCARSKFLGLGSARTMDGLSWLSRTGVGDWGLISSSSAQSTVESILSDILVSRLEKLVIREPIGSYSLTVDSEEMRECDTELLEEAVV